MARHGLFLSCHGETEAQRGHKDWLSLLGEMEAVRSIPNMSIGIFLLDVSSTLWLFSCSNQAPVSNQRQLKTPAGLFQGTK